MSLTEVHKAMGFRRHHAMVCTFLATLTIEILGKKECLTVSVNGTLASQVSENRISGLSIIKAA